MTRLSEKERSELLEDAASRLRQNDFRRLQQRLVQLPPGDYLDFLSQTSTLSTEKASDRPLMTGDYFLL